MDMLSQKWIKVNYYRINALNGKMIIDHKNNVTIKK